MATTEDKPITELPAANHINMLSKTLGIDENGNVVLYSLDLLTRNNIGTYKTTDAAPVPPLPNQNYDLIGTGLGTSVAGTYTNLLTGPATPLVVPAPPAGKDYSVAKAVFKGVYWEFFYYYVNQPNVDLTPYQLKSDALAPDANGNLYGAIVPDVQYKHVRGDVEVAGNSTYVVPAAQDGVAMYEQMTKAIVINQVTVPVWGAADSVVTMRIYKASSAAFNPNVQTLLEEVNVPAGSFNSMALTNAVFTLAGNYKLAVNDYVFIYLNVTAGTKLSYRYWNALYGSAPERHVFAYHTSASGNIWTAAWTAGAAGFYQSSFVLSQKSASQIALEASVKSVQANAVIADTNKNITGVKIPTVQWNHSRGDAETAGNTQYGPATTNYGICYYEQMTTPVVINSIAARIWAASDAAVTVRVYKSAGFTNVIASQTLLEEKVYPTGTFNSAVGTAFEIMLSGTYAVNTSEYVYLYVYWTGGTTATKLASMYWNALYGAAPERHTFLFLSAATGWSSNWTVAGAPFYQASLKFRYRNDVETDLTARVVAVELNKPINPRIAIPAVVNVAIGREFNLWNDNLCSKYGSGLLVNYKSAAGTNFKTKERGMRYTAAAVETNTVTAYVRDRNNAVLAQRDLTIKGVAKNNGSGNLNIVTIGDSTILGSNATIVAPIATELRNLFLTDGGATPYLLGTLGAAPNRHEGRGGWTWSNYLGANVGGVTNAFWDAANSRNDFQKWMTNNANFGSASGNIDVAVIQLGINDVNNSVATNNPAYVDTAITSAKTFINALLSATTGFPNCKVVISMPSIASITRDAWALDYPNYDKDVYEYNMRTYHEKLIANFDAGVFNANVSLSPSYLWIDRVNGYDKTAVAISARNTTTENQYKSGASVHPNDSGYYQLADAIYSQIRSLLS